MDQTPVDEVEDSDLDEIRDDPNYFNSMGEVRNSSIRRKKKQISSHRPVVHVTDMEDFDSILAEYIEGHDSLCTQPLMTSVARKRTITTKGTVEMSTPTEVSFLNVHQSDLNFQPGMRTTEDRELSECSTEHHDAEHMDDNHRPNEHSDANIDDQCFLQVMFGERVPYSTAESSKDLLGQYDFKLYK
jgi:hypothetical protein